MMQNMRAGMPSLFKQGTKHLEGVDMTVSRNIEACEKLSQLTRTSMGPNGMNKIVINHIEKLFVTNDAATIIREMEISHPAAKMLVLAAQMQEQEIGDGSNLVVVLGGELLTKAGDLLVMGLHPNEVVEGYKVAKEMVAKLLDDMVVWQPAKADLNTEEVLIKGIYSALSAKQSGNELLLAKLVAKAALAVMPANKFNFHVDNVRTIKLHGGSLSQCEVVRGIVVTKPPDGHVNEMKDCRVAVYTCAVDTAQTETKGTVLLNNAQELMGFSEGEERHLEMQIKAVADSGVNVMVTGDTLGDLAKHFCDKYNILCLKISSKYELRRIATTTGATMLVSLSGAVPKDEQGHCERIYVREFGMSKVTVFTHKEGDEAGVATIVLRGSTTNVLDDLERAVDDGVNIVKAMGRDQRFLAGAGACDVELARRLREQGLKSEGLEQYAIKAVADALDVVPRVLARNAGMDDMETLSKLYAAHGNGDAKAGIDIDAQEVRDMTESNIYDHLVAKANAIRLALNTAITILRVDHIIMAKPAGGPKMPKQNGHWDDN